MDNYSAENKRRSELEPFKQEDGSYIFRLFVEQEGSKLTAYSPDLEGFRARSSGPSNLAPLFNIASGVNASTRSNFGFNADVYFMKEGESAIWSGNEQAVGLAPGNDYKILVVPETLGLLPWTRRSPVALFKGPGCPLIRPAF